MISLQSLNTVSSKNDDMSNGDGMPTVKVDLSLNP